MAASLSGRDPVCLVRRHYLHGMSMTTASTNSTRQPTGASVNIPPRRMAFDFSPSGMPVNYVDGNGFKSTFVTALSSLFPEGESFFVEAVRHYRGRVTDPVLKAQVSGFIGQEALHSVAHKAFNEAATAQGLPVDKLDRDTGRLLHFLQKVLPPSVQLAITACLEHYTAIFTEMLLRDPAVLETFSPEVRNLYLWHSVEENEHKTVAFDVYQLVSGSYLLRAGVMIPTTIIFFGMIFWLHSRLLAKHGQWRKLRENLIGFNYIFGFRGKITSLLPQFLDWFKPSFHPSHHDTDALLNEWREKLFGVEGELAAKVIVVGQKTK